MATKLACIVDVIVNLMARLETRSIDLKGEHRCPVQRTDRTDCFQNKSAAASLKVTLYWHTFDLSMLTITTGLVPAAQGPRWSD